MIDSSLLSMATDDASCIVDGFCSYCKQKLAPLTSFINPGVLDGIVGQ
jgi:hypothetical protein